MKRRLGLLVTLLAFLLVGAAQAQASLSVNGRDVEGLTLSLVPGVSYAPANPYAAALGARLYLDYGSGLASLELGGRLAVLPTVDGAAAAGMTTITVNGESRPGRPAVFSDGVLYLPVGQLAEAFGGYTSFVPQGERVLVVLPRGRLTEVDTTSRGDSERLVFTVDANVPYAVAFNPALGALEVRFDRTESRVPGSVAGEEHFRRASAVEERGGTRVSISLEDDVRYQVYTVPAGRGYRLVVDLFEATAEEPEPEQMPLVVLDPAHGGSDAGEELSGRNESEITLELATAVAELLSAGGYRVELSRSRNHEAPLSERAGLGVDADLFVSLHVHRGEAARLYYLSEAAGAASLDMAIRRNAAAELQDATDALRRRLLLNLVPDLDVGRRYAIGLQAELFAATGMPVADPMGAPLAVLAGAAGRGLLVELPFDGLNGPATAEALADAIATLLGGTRQR